MDKGCEPDNIAVKPVNNLPPCSGYPKAELVRQMGPSYPDLPSIDILDRFVCKTQPDFLYQRVLKVYKLGVPDFHGSHFALVFMFEQGMMLSELTTKDHPTELGEKLNDIKSTCVSLDVAEIQSDHSLSHDVLPTMMFAINSPLWRNSVDWVVLSRPENSRLLAKTLKRYRTLVFGHVIAPDTSALTGVDIVGICNRYQAAHPLYRLKVDSCITFAHVVFRDLPSLFLEE